MSSPIPSTSGSDPREVRHSSAASSASALALSGLLRVQRRWSLASFAGLETGQTGLTTAADGGHAAPDGAGLDPAGSAGLHLTTTIARHQPVQGAASPVLPTTELPGCPSISRTPGRGRRRVPPPPEHLRSVNVVATMRGSVALSSDRRLECDVCLRCA